MESDKNIFPQIEIVPRPFKTIRAFLTRLLFEPYPLGVFEDKTPQRGAEAFLSEQMELPYGRDEL